MLHFSCDLCGQPLRDSRFVARVEVFPAFDPDEITEEDLDVDHLQDIAELIEHSEITGQPIKDDCDVCRLRFDLCRECRKRYLDDPLGREAFRRVKFSQN